MMKLLLLFVALIASGADARLGTDGQSLTFNGRKVFLSGVNFAWNSYGYDFGNNQYEANSKDLFRTWLSQIGASGGNSVRVWLHVEGYNTPAFTADGYVTGPDSTGTMINDMRDFLDAAQSQNIIVIFVLWNGAVLTNLNVIYLFQDDGKMQTYIDNALKPMVAALGDHPALGAWEIMNEPEGSVLNNEADANPCFDTTPLVYTGAGWTGVNIPMRSFQKAINWQAAAIKEVNAGSLVTLGSWSEHPQSDLCNQCRNYYSDACLVAAGGKPLGTIDFYQMHTYAFEGRWGPEAPFKTLAGRYGLDKPLVIGEFASRSSEGESVEQLYQYAYTSGYQGVWDWSYNVGEDTSCDVCDTQSIMHRGMNQLRGLDGPGGLVNFPVV